MRKSNESSSGPVKMMVAGLVLSLVMAYAASVCGTAGSKASASVERAARQHASALTYAEAQ